jgi:glycosyltransferase involved in cell wall biosynthesis
MTSRKICIVGLDSYAMLANKASRYIGGEAVQHVLLARAWRDQGHDVSMIVCDEGFGAKKTFDGITAIAAYDRKAGVPGLRFFHPRASKLVAALHTADADVYYQSPAGATTGITAWFCRMMGRKFVFRVASDSDVEKEHSRIAFGRDRMLFDFGLKRADLIASQTQFQQRELRKNHDLDSALINMMVELPPRDATPPVKDIDVLWLSNLRSLKRPELALELARELPNVKFTIAGGPMPNGQDYYDDIAASAARLPNVTMLGAVRYEETGPLFDRAKVFLNTSSIEGFPNTFLQAWIRGVPVVSFFDPDGICARMQLGSIATSVVDMREALRGMLDVDAYRETIGRRARDFASREFTSAVATRYLELLDERERGRAESVKRGATS